MTNFVFVHVELCRPDSCNHKMNCIDNIANINLTEPAAKANGVYNLSWKTRSIYIDFIGFHHHWYNSKALHFSKCRGLLCVLNKQFETESLKFITFPKI